MDLPNRSESKYLNTTGPGCSRSSGDYTLRGKVTQPVTQINYITNIYNSKYIQAGNSSTMTNYVNTPDFATHGVDEEKKSSTRPISIEDYSQSGHHNRINMDNIADHRTESVQSSSPLSSDLNEEDSDFCDSQQNGKHPSGWIGS
ncbi:hypothetical protein GDO86_014557 [Hymenochirus boettgeri]|uniref:Uncharacterized protein n=1 Tax=Hymenochirus boettgeri TaxID=247094 RepID=A0A8T2JU71_9PIPI|nr:hypothetical protein GDO86_014557 [Hymenochirus boettgeri]